MPFTDAPGGNKRGARLLVVRWPRAARRRGSKTWSVNTLRGDLMIRTVFAAASAAVIVLGLSAAMAQQDVIKERKDLMKHNGDEAKLATQMAKGEKPFDLAAAHKIFAAFEDAAAKMPDLYPPDSKSEAGSPVADKFTPTEKVWTDMDDFKKRFAKLGDDSKKANATVKDLDSFKEAIGAIGKNDCGGCHHDYRHENKS
jgi:cytochrome c556